MRRNGIEHDALPSWGRLRCRFLTVSSPSSASERPDHRRYGISLRPFGNLLRSATVATGMGKPANVLHVRVAASRFVPVGRRPVALHFIGFRGDEYPRAVRVFGIPDFIHIGWDRWARQEVMPGDTAIFAKGTFEDAPSPYSYPDLHEPPNE
ncbi:hypothetical protein [Sphingomonas panni]|uniref:hypothetical protein n=1 Tax=Sphingomonas panni TaxID=237612 RepID=UPI001F5BBD11|nr:hypothetical protein [Sphingomonas panni]